MAAFSSGYRLPMAPGEKTVVFVFLRLLQLLGMEAIMRAIVVGSGTIGAAVKKTLEEKGA